MKKLFVSCPTTGRKFEDVVKTGQKMHKIAEVIFEQELEMIDCFRVTELTKFDLYDMARHIEAMAEADCFIGVNHYWGDVVDIQRGLAERFKIPIAMVEPGNVIDDWVDPYAPISAALAAE